MLVGVLGATVAVTIGAAIWLGPADRPEAEVEARPTTTTAPVPTTAAPTTTAPPTAAPPATAPPAPTTTGPACPAVEGPAADVDGDGCPDPVSIDGPRVTVEGTTWRAGRPGDMAVVGDWDCDGRATPATLRASTGEVFVFDRWERALTVAATARVDGATGLRAVDPDGDGCATLEADRPGAPPVTVEVAA